jgi:hypothetical protein
MSRTSQLGLALAMVVTLGACTDAGTLPKPHPSSSGPQMTDLYPGTDFDEGDPGEPRPVKIHETWGSISLPSEGSFFSSEAIYTGTMRYDAYHARVSALATTTGPNPFHETFFPKENHTSSFLNNGFLAQWKGHINGHCGNTVTLDLNFSAWWVFTGGWVINEQSKSSRHTVSQSACSSGGGGGGGGMEGGGILRCTTQLLDHYWYYPDTNTYEYRYTEEGNVSCYYYEE